MEINCTNTAIEMAHKYTEDNKKEEVQLPEEFKQHAALFSNKEASKFPPSQEWDHKIELTEHVPASFNCKVYPMLHKEQEAEDKFLDETWQKDTLFPQNLPMAVQHSWYQRKTPMKCGILLTIDPSMLSLAKMSPHSQTLHSASKTCVTILGLVGPLFFYFPHTLFSY